MFLQPFIATHYPGLIFLEARQSSSAASAIMGIVGVFPSRGIKLVPITEMSALLRMKKKEVDFKPGMWVRMKRGKHAGDLAQVNEVDNIVNGLVGIKFLPRIDLTPREKRKERTAGGKALGAVNARPTARPFNYEEVSKFYGRKNVRATAAGQFVFDGDDYIDGFCIRDVRTNLVEVEGVKPSLEELSRFRGDDAEAVKSDLATIDAMNRTSTASGFVPGDKVEVFEGEQTGLQGRVEALGTDAISIRAEGGSIDGQVIEVQAHEVRKRFNVGDHVTVLSGRNANLSGMVVETKGDVVTLTLDVGQQDIQAFSKDLRAAGDISGSGPQMGQFDLHDMVMLE